MKQIFKVLVLPIVCRKLVIHQYLQNLAYVSLRIYCKAKFQSLFVKCLPKQTCLSSGHPSPGEFISGWLLFPSRWSSCLWWGQAGAGLSNCCMAFSGWSFCSNPFRRLDNLNLSACVTCPGAKSGLNLGCLEKSPLQLFVQFRNSSLCEIVTLNYYFFSQWCFLSSSCPWNPVDILAFGSLPFPLHIIFKMEKCFPLFLELIRRACFPITQGSLPASSVYSCSPFFLDFSLPEFSMVSLACFLGYDSELFALSEFLLITSV